MHVLKAHFRRFKRFHRLTVTDLPVGARLVVLAGPNGQGKSSIFDGFKLWHERQIELGLNLEDSYHVRQGADQIEWRNNYPENISVTFDRELLNASEEMKKAFYIRSAYRHEPDFTVKSLSRIGSALGVRRFGRLIDSDISVSENYLRLVSDTIAGIYNPENDADTVHTLRERLIGQVRESMQNVFGNLILTGPGNPLSHGSFFFDKGASKNFHYKNLSGGEKAAFDLLLDVIAKRTVFDDTVFCIDEPELHMHTKLQAALLEEIMRLLPAQSQLWVATHSIGMMRKARDLYSENPDEVVFLDFDQDFDQNVTLTPSEVDRHFWTKTLHVALDDLANLIAPRQVILCEGRPIDGKNTSKAEFDARCYRTIFSAEYPDTDFYSVGNASDVKSDRLDLGTAIRTLISGTTVLRLIDRDDRSEQQIRDLSAAGVRVLGRRHLESYLFDAEILTHLCKSVGRSKRTAEVLQMKALAIEESTARGNSPDDMKSAAGTAYVRIKAHLGLTGVGNDANSFMRDTLAPLVTPNTHVYSELKADIFAD